MTRLIQIANGPGEKDRRVALVDEPRLRLLAKVRSIYELTNAAIAEGVSLGQATLEQATDEALDYSAVYEGHSEWRMLPPIDHPVEPARCMISGTGLTHLGSAQGRQAMHAVSGATTRAATAEPLTDSMKMFRWGIEHGRPAPGAIGTPPEWFYKGTGAMLRGHGEPLEVPAYAEDGGEEAEVAGIYLIDSDGQPRRLGMAAGNEFSDHQFEKKNYLNLAGSKLRTCALGPELAIDPDFQEVTVEVKIERGGSPLWCKSFHTGEAAMCHSLQNIEHHHFKYEGHRRPGDVHIHFFGTAALSFGDGIRLRDGDVMQVAVQGFGRPLRNPVRIAGSTQKLVSTIAMR
jgi:hypothetical protein